MPEPALTSSTATETTEPSCRPGCGACCIAPSISSPIPGMPDGKPAGVRCVHLDADFRCLLFGKPERPEVCNRLRPEVRNGRPARGEAPPILALLERVTRPASAGGP